ncbi:hypothetical protein QFZ43_007658 [Streptomyces afghaniensis]|nr:hypothetical protein [Streptomyces afghaniensis]
MSSVDISVGEIIGTAGAYTAAAPLSGGHTGPTCDRGRASPTSSSLSRPRSRSRERPTGGTPGSRGRASVTGPAAGGILGALIYNAAF